jgi:hypothetical protein
MHQELWGYKVEEKLYVGVREHKNVEYRWFILPETVDIYIKIIKFLVFILLGILLHFYY